MSRKPVDLDPNGSALASLLGAVTNLNDTMAQIHTGQKTRDAARLLGADNRTATVAFGTTSNAGLLSSSPGVLLGLNLREIVGTTTTVRILDGIDSGGAPLWTGYVPATGEVTRTFGFGNSSAERGAAGLSFTNGLFVQLLAGGVLEVVVYLSGGNQ